MFVAETDGGWIENFRKICPLVKQFIRSVVNRVEIRALKWAKCKGLALSGHWQKENVLGAHELIST